MNQSPYNRSNEKSPQLTKNDNFIPLGFSSPINQQQNDNSHIYPSQQRNYDAYTGNWRPNFRNNHKNRYTPNSRPSYENRSQQHYPQHQQNHHNQKHQSWSNRKLHQDYSRNTLNKSREDDSQGYFHPSMLEDPWKHLGSQFASKQKSNVHLENTEANKDSTTSAEDDQDVKPSTDRIEGPNET